MIYQKAVLPALAYYGKWKGKGDDECAHELALAWIKALERVPGLMGLLRFATEECAKTEPFEAFGIRFPGRLGLAAGLDKEGVGLPFWEALGFGFAEIGTITPYRQPGNPRPRMFRLDGERELINRMGFNSQGMLVAGENLARGKKRVRMPVGISYGKMKETPNDEAYLDYSAVLRHTIHVADFGVVNVSSPNTAGLRDLQARESIEGLLRYLRIEMAGETFRYALPGKPLLVKVAPDLTDAEFDIVVEAVLAAGIAGLVIGNTTVKRPEGSRQLLYGEAGGLSGGLLFDRALELCRRARAAEPRLALIMVGGIDSVYKAAQALEVADLIEVLTAFVFQGPALIRAIRRVPTVQSPRMSHLRPKAA
jgi:dihydroorotate dehydrogenase